MTKIAPGSSGGIRTRVTGLRIRGPTARRRFLMLEPELIDFKTYPSFGECIYCGAKGTDVELTDEHIIPFSLGANAIILDGSCKPCARETGQLEGTIGRGPLWEMRISIGEQTRRPRERPTEGTFFASVNGGSMRTIVAPIDDCPVFTPFPVWGMPGLLDGRQPSVAFAEYKAHLFYWMPDNIRKTVGAADWETIEVRPSRDLSSLDSIKFARALAKMAYCQTVVRFGLRGFRRLVLPDLILGRYPCVPHFVGSPLVDPEPPGRGRVKHTVRLSVVTYGRLRLLLAELRLYSNSGTDAHGPPVYYVVVGAPLTSDTLPRRGIA